MRGWGGGETSNMYIVLPVKTIDLVPPLTKAQCTFISAGFQIANNKKQGGALKP